MELKELTMKVCDLFGCVSTESLTDKIMISLMTQNQSYILKKYRELCPDLSVDWLQKIYQFYLADREGKKQDYTPISLAKLTAALAFSKDDTVVYDCCSGSGSLSLQRWGINPNQHFICEELDERVIPILLFNFCLRNISATVINKNILTGEVLNRYEVIKGTEYGTVQKVMFPDGKTLKADCAISNPPFNLREPVSAYITKDLPAKYTCNFAFIAHCLQRADRCAIILPQGVLTSREEMECRDFYISKGWLKAAISLPEKMFESTPVCTCILLFDINKKTKDVMLVNATEMKTVEVREQRGEGDASHYNRIYQKKFNVFSDEQILAVSELVYKEQENYSMKIRYEDLKEHKFCLSLTPYLPVEMEMTLHRDFNAIISDINRIIRDRNIIRLTVNKVWAENLGLTEVITDLEKNNEIVKDMNKLLSSLNFEIKEPILESSYARISASKVLMVENTDKEKLSSIMPFFMNMYKQHIYYLNEEENRYLAELRDSMLPFLMNGTLYFKENTNEEK